MPGFDSWVQTELGLWVPGDGAELPLVQNGASVKAQTGQVAGRIPYITNAGVLRAPTLEGDSANITNVLTAGTVKGAHELANGLKLGTEYGNMLIETSSEYGMVAWNVSAGSASANYDSRYGGPNILFGSAVSTEIFTAAPVYDPVGFQSYWLTFHLPYLAAGATFEYKVELYNQGNDTLQGTIIPWTSVAGTGWHAIDLSAGTWPTTADANSFLRVFFRSSDTARLRLVSLSTNEPTMPDPDRVAREWMAYHRTMAGMYFQTHVGYDYSIAAAAELAWSDFRIYVPQGYRVKLGRVGYSLSNIYLRMRVSMTNTWESSTWYGVGTVNMTLEPTRATSGAYLLATVSTRNSGGATYTLGKRDSITLSLFVLPF